MGNETELWDTNNEARGWRPTQDPPPITLIAHQWGLRGSLRVRRMDRINVSIKEVDDIWGCASDDGGRDRAGGCAVDVPCRGELLLLLFYGEVENRTVWMKRLSTGPYCCILIHEISIPISLNGCLKLCITRLTFFIRLCGKLTMYSSSAKISWLPILSRKRLALRYWSVCI